MEDVKTTDSSQEEVSKEQVSVEESSTTDTSEEQTESQEEQSDSDVSPELSKFKLEDLPPELQAQYKEMQKAFHEDKQSIAKLRKKAEELDRLESEKLIKSKFPEPEAKPSSESTDLLAEALGVDVKGLDDVQRQQLEQLAKIVDHAAKKRVEENIRPIQNDLLQRDYQAELAEVKKKYEDFDEYKSEIGELLKSNPNMGYEQAYKIVSWDSQTKKGRTEAIKNLEAKEKKSQPKATATAKESENPEGIENIFKWAKGKMQK